MSAELHRFDAPWGMALRVMSVLLTVLLGGIAWIGLRSPAPPGWAWYPAMVAAPLALLAGGLLYSVRGFVVGRDRLWIRRPGWSTAIDLDGLELVAADPGAMIGSRRLLANGGLFSFCGRFRSKRLGIYQAWATDPGRSVILRWPKRTVVITPDDPERFVRTVCALRGLEAQRPQ